MNNTTNIQLPFLQAAQAQKHITINESLQMLDALLFLTVISRGSNAPPSNANDGDRYLVPPSSGWGGSDNSVASYRDGAWHYHTPRAGWLAYIIDEQRFVLYHNGAWQNDLGHATLSGLGIAAPASAGSALPSATPDGWWHITIGGQIFRVPLWI